MAQEQTLATVLSDLARTLATDFSIQRILDNLVKRIVDILPITSAGVTLITDGRAPRYVAASDQSALRFERLQTAVWQGPCLTTYESGDAVAIPDLAADQRFPRFSPQAIAGGLAAVFTFPLNHPEGRLGALDLYRDTVGDLDPHDMEVAQTLADVATSYLIIAQEREEARESADLFRNSALHDPLTGLPNRLVLHQRLEHAAQRAQRSHTNAAVLFIDLDRFKQVNDSFGHRVGDHLLIAVAHRLSGLIRPGDTLARISGDEFVFLCEDLESPADIEILAERIGDAFRSSFVLPDTELSISASIGMAYAGPGEEISHDQIALADAAMYQAKRQGGAQHKLIDLREVVQANEHNLETDLRAALEEHQLDVAYQPIVRSTDGLVTGVEALLRWSHPGRGAISPVTLIAVAEQSGLITNVGAWVLAHSCRDRSRWLADHPAAPLDLAVNVSALQLLGPDFTATVADILDRTGMDPLALVLEITENILLDDSKHAKQVLADLKKLGIRIALDDFGTGYSSLSYLRRLPIDIVKIDRGFVADIGYAPSGGAIVSAVTNLAHILGMTVTAEGIETREQRDEINAMGCESSQGYFYARPMSASDIDAHLTTGSAHAPRLPAAAASP